MNWQEYQEAAARLYEQAEGIGEVRRNVFLPDIVTGQARQVDVLLEVPAKGHLLRVLIDAKFRARKLDVTVVEGVIELARAVGVNKAVLVAVNGWTGPAEIKATARGVDLLLLTLDEALELVVEDKWEICPSCQRDCIVLQYERPLEIGGRYSMVLAGQCRICALSFVWCWACGGEGYFYPGESAPCDCGHVWEPEAGRILVRLAGEEQPRAL